MAGEFNNSNRSSSLSADQDITNTNPTASDSAFTGSWGSSSSSFLTTPFEWELDLSATDNDEGEDEFIVELTRQMANYMLQEDVDDNYDNKTPGCLVSQNSISQVKNRNQYRAGENSKRGRRGKMTESTQRMKYSSGGRGRPVGYGQLTPSGSGMRAIFLNGPGSKNGSSGTGVFLPCSATDSSAQSRKKPGCSTALVPTRVLQALEQHFNNMESFSPLNSLLQTQPAHQGQRSGMKQKLRLWSTSTDHVEKKLPREWTY